MRYQRKEVIQGNYWENEEYIEILAEQIGEIAIKTNKPVNWSGGIEI